ncbi:hypothetical protein H5410_003029, partial [Solanum commersonii]
ELQGLANHCELFHCVHTYREANSTSDLLSKQSHKQDIIQHYYTFNQLPKAASGSYILEEAGILSFKRKRNKSFRLVFIKVFSSKGQHYSMEYIQPKSQTFNVLRPKPSVAIGSYLQLWTFIKVKLCILVKIRSVFPYILWPMRWTKVVDMFCVNMRVESFLADMEKSSQF